MVPPNSILHGKFIESAPLVESIWIIATSQLIFAWGVASTLSSIRSLCIISFSFIVDEPFTLKEIFAPSLILSIVVCITNSLVRVVLNIDLVMLLVSVRWTRMFLAIVSHIFLKPVDKPHQLLPLHLFWVEVISFSYVKMWDNFFRSLSCKHVLIYQDVVVVLIVCPLLEVVNDRHFRRIILEHQLSRHWWDKTTRKR